MEPARDTPVRTYHATFPDSVTNAEADERNGPPTLEKCGEFKEQDRNEAKTERALEKTEKPATFEKKSFFETQLAYVGGALPRPAKHCAAAEFYSRARPQADAACSERAEIVLAARFFSK